MEFLSNEKLAVITAAGRMNDILTPKAKNVGLVKALVSLPDSEIRDLFQSAMLDAGSWRVPSVVMERIKYTEQKMFPSYGDLPPIDLARGTNRANANDKGGRVHSFIHKAAELYYRSGDFQPNIRRAWMERFCPQDDHQFILLWTLLRMVENTSAGYVYLHTCNTEPVLHTIESAVSQFCIQYRPNWTMKYLLQYITFPEVVPEVEESEAVTE